MLTQGRIIELQQQAETTLQPEVRQRAEKELEGLKVGAWYPGPDYDVVVVSWSGCPEDGLLAIKWPECHRRPQEPKRINIFEDVALDFGRDNPVVLVIADHCFPCSSW